MKRIIPHSRPTIDAKDALSLKSVVQLSQISSGKQCEAFEKKLSRYFGLKYAGVVNSGTSALHLSLLALGIGRGDEVIIPTFVCTALLNAVKYTGSRPRVVDVNEVDYNISVTEVKKAITSRTRAIIVPHMFGCPADIKELTRLGVPVIEDCAQSIGARYYRKKVGTFGEMAVCSFYATKMMTSGEGGAVLSNNSSLIKATQDLKSYDHKNDYHIRYNNKMMDIQAALGINQLLKLNQFIQSRRAMASIYSRNFSDPNIKLPQEQTGKKHVYFRYVIRLSKKRDSFIKCMAQKGIICAKPLFKPLHQYLGLRGFSVAEKLYKESVSLPIYPSLTKTEMRRIVTQVKAFDFS